MIDSATLELLRSMKLSAMASELKKQLEQAKAEGLEKLGATRMRSRMSAKVEKLW